MSSYNWLYRVLVSGCGAALLINSLLFIIFGGLTIHSSLLALVCLFSGILLSLLAISITNDRS